MKKLLNTFYITTADAYLSLDGENIVILQNGNELKRAPLHNLEGIITFGRQGASPALMRKCAKDGISLTFLSEYGHFLASIVGEINGNVLLRKVQYRTADSDEKSIKISRNILVGKLHNSRWVLERTIRDHAIRVNVEKFKQIIQIIANTTLRLREVSTYEELLGLEGEAASQYFSIFDEMILNNKNDFYYHTRSRRPPLDNVNALLSFTYTLLANDLSSALLSVGLDPFVGFYHKDRPGRRSLALDMMEELRAPLADRFVLKLINMRQINGSDFIKKENGSVLLNDDARKTFLTEWQNRKQDIIEHPYLNEKIAWGLVPHAQALLLSRFLRGDLD